MSAISLIVTEAAAHLVTDASFYDPAGTLIQVRSKVTASPSHRIAVACTGCCDRNRIAARLQIAPDQRQAIRWAVEAVEGIRAENDGMNPGGAATGHNDLMLFIAAWSEQHDAPRGYVVASSQAWLGPQYQPYSMVDVMALASPPVPLDQWCDDDAAACAGRFLDAQRQSAWEGDEKATFVGGFGELTTITRDGLEQARVREWPDQIGQRVTA